MPALTITRGLPGSGKTTHARAWVAEDPIHRARSNRDDLRAQLHDGAYHGRGTEQQIIAVQHVMIRSLLRRGVDVICDDTNLPSRTVRDLRRVAALCGAGFVVVDMTDVPLEECLRRNASREGRGRVPDETIRDMHQRCIAGRPHPLPIADEPADATTGSEPVLYVPPGDVPKAVMVDVDGTVALMASRSPYDESRVNEDRPNVAVIAVVRALWFTGYKIVFCSGRTEACRAATLEWLAEHVPIDKIVLHMRPVGDMRKDTVVKRELFDQHIRNKYNVVAVLDDRRTVVDMWRALGLTVLQVAPGEF